MCCFLRKKKDAGSSLPPARQGAVTSAETLNRVSRRQSLPISPIATIHTEQPKDDAAIIRLFSLIETSITDHVLNYYITNTPGTSNRERFLQFGKNKREFVWVQHVTLDEAKMQVVVIRSVIGAEIFKAVRDGLFVPAIPGMSQNPRRAESRSRQTPRNPPASSIDPKARIEFFYNLPRNPHYVAHRKNAISTLTDGIMRLTFPLITDKKNEEARRCSLESIINSAADFAVTTGKQTPHFRVSFPQLKGGNSSGSRRGKTENTDAPVLVPELRKYGDERGLGYERYIALVPVQKLPENL
ncbi:hypothetical protein DFP73DRAFT_405320 [Morchella snyderi]|nr:hypothetical protein DFP73DRAFT_405320 [Morchella snyderi]